MTVTTIRSQRAGRSPFKSIMISFSAYGSRSRLRPGRKHIKRHRENSIDEQEQGAYEPGRASAVGDEARGQGSDQDHDDRSRPELQIHRMGADDVTEQHQHGRNEQ